jgi:hypothetical protein
MEDALSERPDRNCLAMRLENLKEQQEQEGKHNAVLCEKYSDDLLRLDNQQNVWLVFDPRPRFHDDLIRSNNKLASLCQQIGAVRKELELLPKDLVDPALEGTPGIENDNKK